MRIVIFHNFLQIILAKFPHFGCAVFCVGREIERYKPADGTGELPLNTAALETAGTEGVVAGEEAGLSVGLLTEVTQQRVPLSLSSSSSVSVQAVWESMVGRLTAREHPARHFELCSFVIN